MTLVRSFVRRSSLYWSYHLRYSHRTQYLSSSKRLFSLIASRTQEEDENTRPAIRYLEQNDDGKYTDYSDSETEAATLKARIEELEKELKQYAKTGDFAGRPTNEVFGDIFDRMPDDLRPKRISREDLKAMIKRGDPEAMSFDGAEELAKEMKDGDENGYDADKIFERLPQEMRANLTREQLRKLIEQDDPSIQEYLYDEVVYDLKKTYAQLPDEMKATVTIDQVRTMIENRDAAIEEYLYQVKNPYNFNQVYARLPKDKKAIWTKKKVKEMLENNDPAFKEYLSKLREEREANQEMDVYERARKDLFGGADEDEALHVGIPEHVRVHMNSFNKIMRDVASQSKDHKSIGLFWAKYELCKKYVPGFLEEIPPQVWRILWLSQWAGNLILESRKSHLWTLVNDMIEVNRPLDHDQRLVYIEYEFSEGSKATAMKTWRRDYSELKDDDPKRDEYRDLGVRIHVEAGLLAEAQDLIFGKRRKSQIKASDVAILVAAKASQPDETSVKVAWSFYLDMRERLGDKIKLEDYDQIAMTFLGVNRPNLALAVFKDMVLSVRLQSNCPNTQIRSLGLLQQLQNQAKDKQELDRISLESLASIPRQMENKYFYASWIKRLIGLNEVDSTIQVLELMFQRRVRPDARHVNGIIGAWLRGQDRDKHQLALQIGWSMVNERLKFVARRNNAVAGNVKAVDSVDGGRLIPPYISQNLPPANVETFCLLLLYYQRRSMTQSVEMVTNYIEEAEIAPNSFFMNHLIYAELRKQNIGKAWKIFESGTRMITPDLETFSALWSCEKAFTTGHSAAAPEFPRSRRLYLRMSQWFQALQGRILKQTLESFSKEMYNEVVRCFCHQKDIEGTIVALYGLRDMFGAYPNPETERIVLIQLARMGEGSVPRGRRGRAAHRFSANTNSVQDFAKITKIASLVKEQRIQALKLKDIDDSSLEGKQRKEEDLYRIAELLRISLRHQAGSDLEKVSPQEEHIGSVATEMGLPRVNMSPPKI